MLCQEIIDSATPVLSSTAAAKAHAKPFPPSQTTTTSSSSLSYHENVHYPSTSTMKLLPLYDDGLSANQIGGEDEASALLGTLVMDNGEVRLD